MRGHPLIEIHFHRRRGVEKVEKTVHWYHAPRIGDGVLIGDYETSNLSGTVKRVVWLELEGVVDIELE